MSFKSLLLILCLSASSAVAQSTLQITLLNKEDSSPIVDATFQYGKQIGTSDANGIISFIFISGETMMLSHIAYGSWQWNESEILRYAKEKVFYRAGKIVNLYPVTIISVRPNQQPEDQVNIDYQDRLQHDGAAILNQIPAFNSVRKSGGYGFDPVFRGYKYDQLNIVLNGAQSATSACPNRMDPPTSQMAPNMMDRIEVLKGPYALRYGTGFGGTINFVPAQLNFNSANKVYGRASSSYESNGNNLRSEGRIGFNGNNYDISIFGAFSQGDDYKTGDGAIIPAGYTRSSFGTQLGLKISDNQKLRVSGIYNRARDAEFAALPMDLREDDTWMFNARHDVSFQKEHLKSWNTTVFGSFVDHLMDNLLKFMEQRMMNAATHATTYNYGGRTEGIWKLKNGQLFAGTDLKIEGADGTRSREFLMGPNAGNIAYDNVWQKGQISKTGAFAEYHLHTHILDYVFSGRIEVNQAKITAPSEMFTQVNENTKHTQLNPGFSLGIQKLFKDDVKVGLWLGRVQRSGSLTERFINYFPVGQDPYEMLGNPELNPEVNNQIDLTLEWKSENTALNIDLFASVLQDYISSVIDTTLSPRLPMSPGVRQFINLDKVHKTGFEINWKQNLPFHLQQQIGLSYTYAQDMERDQPLPEIPPMDMRYTLRGHYLKSKLSPEIMLRYVLEQSRISKEFGETVTPPFALVDVKLAYEVSKKVRINAGVYNIFDENYYEHLSRSVRGTNTPIYAPGRNFFTSLSVQF